MATSHGSRKLHLTSPEDLGSYMQDSVLARNLERDLEVLDRLAETMRRALEKCYTEAEAPPGHEFFTTASLLSDVLRTGYPEEKTTVTRGIYEPPEPNYHTDQSPPAMTDPREVEVRDGFEFSGSLLVMANEGTLVVNGLRECCLVPLPKPDRQGIIDSGKEAEAAMIQAIGIRPISTLTAQ